MSAGAFFMVNPADGYGCGPEVIPTQNDHSSQIAALTDGSGNVLPLFVSGVHSPLVQKLFEMPSRLVQFARLAVTLKSFPTDSIPPSRS